MRIALAVTEFPTVSQTFVLDHVAGLMSRGHRVEVQALRPVNGTAKLQDDWLHQVAVRLPPPAPAQAWLRRFAALWHFGMLAPRDLPRAWRLLAKSDESDRLGTLLQARAIRPRLSSYELVHAHSGQNGRRLLTHLDANGRRVPLVVTFHGHDVHGHLRDKPCGYYEGLFQRADALIVCSGFMRERLLALGAPAAKLRLIPNPVAADNFPYRPREALPCGTPVELLSIGRLVAFKGTATLLAALARPELRNRDWRLHLVGDGPLRATLQAQAAEAGLSERVHFHGALSREQFRPLWERAGLYLSPALVDNEGNTETQGVALLEALACGLPVIASAVGGIPETLGEAAAALVPPGEPAALAAAIARLLDEPERWPALSRAGRARVEAHYQNQAWLDRLEQLYNSLNANN